MISPTAFASSSVKSPLMDANETKKEFNNGRKSPMYVVVWRISAESRSWKKAGMARVLSSSAQQCMAVMTCSGV